jgi:hypothetical protein
MIEGGLVLMRGGMRSSIPILESLYIQLIFFWCSVIADFDH